MDFIFTLPAIVKILSILCLIILFIKLKLPLGLSLLVGGIFLGATFKMSPTQYLTAFLKGIFSSETINLVVVIVGILILSSALSVSGRLDRIVESFKRIFGESRITLVTFPALIGLLPMPGGAVFSAPMVGAITDKSSLTPVQKTVINYWFRHIWEYWYPLYPGAILAISLSKLPAWKFMLMNFPMTLMALGAGYLIILRKLSLSDKKHRDYSWINIKRFLIELIPILTVIFCMFFLGMLFSKAETLLKVESDFFNKAPIIIGLILSFMWVEYNDRLGWVKIKGILMKKNIWEMAFLVLGLMIFKSVLTESGAVVTMKKEFLDYNIPVLPLIMMIPFIGGLVTGIAVGFVGVSYPIVVSLIMGLGIAPSDTGHLFFISYVAGYTGMMLSPVHLCLLLTKDYFKSGMFRVYTDYLLPTILLTLIPAAIMFFIYRSMQI